MKSFMESLKKKVISFHRNVEGRHDELPNQNGFLTGNSVFYLKLVVLKATRNYANY